MINLIGLILTFLSSYWLILYFIKMKKRKSVVYDVERGYRCYKCKCEIEENAFSLVTPNKTMCKSCKRDDALSEVVGNNFKLFKFDLSDKKWSRVHMILSICAVVFNLLNLFLPGMNIVGGSCLFVGQAIFYFRFMSMSIPDTH